MQYFQDLTPVGEDGKRIVLDSSSKFKHMQTHMDFGHALRKKADRGDLLALMAIDKIGPDRPRDADAPQLEMCAHILTSLKHPELTSSSMCSLNQMRQSCVFRIVQILSRFMIHTVVCC